tara:strand:- start:1049 stop:1372 length:324 start_codon:yes stop_codon:yes gene_type:complete
MKYKSINFVSNNLIDVINKDLDNILQNMCCDYLLDYEKIKKKYISPNFIENNIQSLLDSNIRCLGIIKSGCQCARTRKNDSDFCLIHQKSLKFGKKQPIYPKVDSPE